MDALDVPLAAAALLLVPSGVAKLRRPADTERALRAVRLPGGATRVRVLGAGELVVGLGVVLDGARPGWSVALGALYAGFAAFVLLALWRRAPLTSCGCFGAAGVTPTPLHAGVDAGLAAVALLTALDPRSSPLDIVL